MVMAAEQMMYVQKGSFVSGLVLTPAFPCALNRELLLNNNQLRVLPFELGKLFQLQTLGLKGECGLSSW